MVTEVQGRSPWYLAWERLRRNKVALGGGPGGAIAIDTFGPVDLGTEYAPNVQVVNCTFAHNESDGPGGSIFVRQMQNYDETVQGPSVRVVNSIFTGELDLMMCFRPASI